MDFWLLFSFLLDYDLDIYIDIFLKWDFLLSVLKGLFICVMFVNMSNNFCYIIFFKIEIL